MEINRDSTAGMTHGQAVEQIRTGGSRIHLVFKRGNGYVPDYGKTTGQRSAEHHIIIHNPKHNHIAFRTSCYNENYYGYQISNNIICL